MKLYWFPGSCSLAPHIVLRETGLKFETVKVDLFTKAMEGGGDFRDVNPRGAIPALAMKDGEILTQASVIMQYLADQAPEAGLLPAAGTLARYRVLEWLNHLASELHKGFSGLFNPAAPDGYKDMVRKQIDRHFGEMDEVLSRSDWLVDGRYSLADIYAFVISGWAGMSGMDISHHAAFEAFRKRVAERPAVQAALAAEGLA